MMCGTEHHLYFVLRSSFDCIAYSGVRAKGSFSCLYEFSWKEISWEGEGVYILGFGLLYVRESTLPPREWFPLLFICIACIFCHFIRLHHKRKGNKKLIALPITIHHCLSLPQ